MKNKTHDQRRRELLADHATNIEAALLEKVEDLNDAADQVQGLLREIESATDLDEAYIRRELRGIWSCVMETPYDPEY